MKFSIQSIRKSSVITNQGEITPSYEVYYQLENGMIDSIELLENQFTKERVREEINKRVSVISDVFELGISEGGTI